MINSNMNYLLFILSTMGDIIQIKLKIITNDEESVQKVKVKKILKKFEKSC